MAELKNTMEIFKLLDQSNCRECNEKTCLAFAASVFKGKRQLKECPHLSSDVLEKYSGNTRQAQSIEEDMADAVEHMKSQVASIDFAEAAARVKGKYQGDKLTIRIFGKNFSVDSNGELYSDVHINPWIAIPVLTYFLSGGGAELSGKWIPFRELKNGMVRDALFQRRCERPLKRVADEYTDFFKDLLDIFDGKQVDNLFDSDISIVLYPLPLVPILICYWSPEEGLESSFHLFFDSTAEENLHIEALYTLIAGFAYMFEKIASRHAA
jgi:hypothetical protein